MFFLRSCGSGKSTGCPYYCRTKALQKVVTSHGTSADVAGDFGTEVALLYDALLRRDFPPKLKQHGEGP